MDITFEEFVNNSQNSLSWYDFLTISEDLRIVNAPSYESVISAYKSIICDFSSDKELIFALDIFSAYILNSLKCPKSVNNEFDILLTITSVSRLMALNLTALGSRSLRMRAQRLNYLLQSFATSHHLISSHSPPNTDNMIVPFQKPWDFLFLDELEIFLYSEDSNVHIKKSSSSESCSIGLPTQLTMFDGKIIRGSIYYCGYSVYTDNNIYSVEYPQPILLLFDFKGVVCALSHFGSIYSINSKQVIHKLPLTQVHFARLIDNKLFCLDNSSFGIIYSLCCVTGELFVHNILPVMVCNDICKHFNTYYLIDKQQGSVFLFDESFQYIDRYLDYGYSSNNLADPVAIHSSKDKIYVLSWLTSRITSFSAL